MTEHDIWSCIQRLDASQQQVVTVEIIMRGPLEVLAAGLLSDKVVVRGRA
jgi:hypothetical protein